MGSGAGSFTRALPLTKLIGSVPEIFNFKDPKREKGKQAKEQSLALANAAQAAKDQENIKTQAAEESVRLQKEQNRKRTIFAGAQDGGSLFKKVLGGRSTLG